MNGDTTTAAMHPLRVWRTRKGMSLEEFGRRIGRSAAAVSRYEAGIRDPRRQTLQAIARATGGKITAADFFAPARKRRARR